MSLINLGLLEKLRKEAFLKKAITDVESFNWPGESDQVDPHLFIYIIKGYNQANNLYQRLTALHETCQQIVNATYQPDLLADEDPESATLDALRACVGTESIHDLPPRIDQYAELVEMTASFAQGRKMYLDGLTDLGFLPKAKTEEHRRLSIENEMADVDVEYALDRYDEFYAKVSSLLSRDDLPAKEVAHQLLTYFV